jgi:hypothetical protein
MLQPVTFASYGHDMGVVQQAVQQRRRQRCVLRKRRVPLPERQIACHDQAAFFVQRRDYLEEQVGLFTVHRQVAVEALDLALGFGPVRLAQLDDEAAVLGKVRKPAW